MIMITSEFKNNLRLEEVKRLGELKVGDDLEDFKKYIKLLKEIEEQKEVSISDII